MKRLMGILLLLFLLIPSLPATAQDDPDWTCDGGENDVLNAALAAEEAGDLEYALELAIIAEDLCQSDFQRWREATQLRQRLETLTAEQTGSAIDPLCEGSITIGDVVTGQINDINWFDGYCFTGTEGDEITITLNATSGDLDPLLALFDPAQELIAGNQNANNSLNAQVTAILPATQTYLIFATRFQTDEGTSAGDYELITSFGSPPPPEELSPDLQRAAELNELGRQATLEGRYAEALAYFQEGLALVSTEAAQTDPLSVNARSTLLINSGNVYQNQGDFTSALDLYFEALPLTRSTSDYFSEAVVLNNIGLSYVSLTQYEQGLEFYQQALSLHREIGDRRGEGITLGNIGNIYAQQGRYDEAIALFEEALLISEELNDVQEIGTRLNNIGSVYNRQSQYAQALNYFQQALALFREIGFRRGEATSLSNIGNVYLNQGQFQQALNAFQESLVILQDIGDRASSALVLNNIGAIYAELEQYEPAINFYEQALPVFREIGDRNGEASTLINLGVVLSVQEQFEPALETFQQALNIMEDIGNQAALGVLFNNIGEIYQRQGHHDEALAYFEQGIATAEQVNDRAAQSQIIYNIANSYYALGQISEARQQFESFILLRETLLQNAGSNEAIANLAAGRTTDVYARLTTLSIVDNDVLGAIEYAERGRSILLRDELRNNVIDFRAGITDDALLVHEETLRLQVVAAQATVDALSQDISASATDIQNAQAELEAARAAYDAHLEVMQLQGGFLARELSLSVATHKAMQATLDEDETLLLYGASEFDIYAILVTQNDLQGFAIDSSGEDVNGVAEAIRAFNTDRRANASALQNLYTLLFAPIADEITTSNLIISPTGILNYVPFTALQNPETGRYLIEDYTISNTPSGTALVLLRERQNQSTAEASSDGLILSQRDAPGLQPLRNADSEVQTIAANLNATGITSATESDLRNSSTGAEIIHISAHAELNRFAPLFSTIHLGADDEHDGRFEVREIYELDLTQGTELVVLSGCETGSGGDGEDFGLLNRAFFGAGAPRVVSSLWAVDDEATAVLLTRFYENLETTDNYAEALRMAMLETMADYPEPYFWAPFVLNGLAE